MRTKFLQLIFVIAAAITTASAQTVTPFNENGKAGYKDDASGAVVIPAIYEVARVFTEGLACVQLNGKYGYINTQNETVIPFEYDFAGKVSNGMARVKKDGLWGFINVTTKAEIPLQFTSANDFSEGLASVKNASGQWGFIDAGGNYMISPQFTKAESFKNGLALVHNGSGFVKINTSGQVVANAER